MHWQHIKAVAACAYHPVKPYIKEFCTVIHLISVTTGLHDK